MITKDVLEKKQIHIYIVTLLFAALTGLTWSGSATLQDTIEPIIGILLYSMFCQIPFLEVKKSFRNPSFFKALLFGNFVLIPLLVWILIQVFALSTLTTIGVLLVLLTPCIDYVIVFTHLGKGDSNSVLAATPVLFIVQMLLLPLFLWLFIGRESIEVFEITPFVKTFFYLIVIPFASALITQWASKATRIGGKMMDLSSWLPVPFMALTFFVVIASQIRTLSTNPQPIYDVLPIYILFAIVAPLAGLLSSKIFKLSTAQARAVAFSSSTRNSLVVLPLALALPAPDNQLVAVVIVTQTVVEILFELLYIKIIPKMIRGNDK
ncbi:arsenic resistance protein [Sphingobacterium tabacisoli]|uniref:Arsenic resistance protein n=1 Tax=Sphingobacterium tabacisoli TaxID=2044855 RepID=A0ABW5L2J2_9SPHI|nr:arsenic resistance protein [Sphingobacterium tabacisoli]